MERIEGIVADPATPPDATGVLSRVLSVLRHIWSYLDAVDPGLLTDKSLGQLHQSLEHVSARVESYIAAPADSWLLEIEQYTDILIDGWPFLPLVQRPRDRADISAQEARAYTQRLQDMESAVRERVVSVESKITEVDGEIASVREELQKVDAAAQEAVTQINQETASRIEAIRSEIDAQKSRLDSAIAEYQAQFLTSQEDRLSQFTKSQQERASSFIKETQTLLEKAQAAIDEVSREAGRLVTGLKDKEEKAREILAITAASVTAGAYVDHAENQRKQADNWRIFAVGVGIIFFIGTVLVSIFAPPGDDLSTSDILLFGAERLPAAVILGTIFTYAFRQSADHRQRETEAKRMANELTTFRPFVSELPEGKQQEITAEASKRYFPGHKPRDSL